MPAVMTTTSEPAVSSYPLEPVIRALVPTTAAGFEHIESLALGQILNYVHENYIGVAELMDPLGGRGAHIAGADDGYFASHVVGGPPIDVRVVKWRR